MLPAATVVARRVRPGLLSVVSSVSPVVVFSCWLDLKLGDYRRGWWGRRARHHRDYHILPRSARPPG